jgi:biopolymer transport protein ExbB/TolQ
MMNFLQTMGIVAYPLLLCSIMACAIVLRQLAFVWNLYRTKATLDEDDIIPSEAFLRFIVHFTPMLGLLGTVLGIMSSFKSISNMKGAVSPSLISAGLHEALLTTIFGLSIALCSLFMLTVIEEMCKCFVKNEAKASYEFD